VRIDDGVIYNAALKIWMRRIIEWGNYLIHYRGGSKNSNADTLPFSCLPAGKGEGWGEAIEKSNF